MTNSVYSRKKGDIVMIQWQDPETDAGWFEADDLPPLDIVVSCGIFIKEDEKTLWVASSYHEGTKEFADKMTYPKGCILHVETIYSPCPHQETSP